MVLAVSAMNVFREPISELIGRIVMKAGPVRVKAKAPGPDKIVKQIREIAAHLAASDTEHLDAVRFWMPCD
jgi:hypothetical protein